MISSATRIQQSRNYQTPAGATITEEGLALIAFNDNGVQKAVVSTGAGTDIFLGFALNHQMTPSTLPSVGQATAVGTTLTLPVATTPLSGQLLLKTVAGLTLTAGNPANAGEYSVSGNVVTLNGAQTGVTVNYVLRYSPTLAQITTFWGEGAQTGLQSRVNAQNSTSVITIGTVATTCFAAGDYVPGRPVKLGANGLVTPESGAGVLLAGVTVEAAPDAIGNVLLLDVKHV